MEPSTDQETPKEPTLGDKLRALLTEFENAPTAQELEMFKQKHGDIFLSALSDDEVFIFKALTRRDHRAINSEIAENKLASDQYEEEVVKRCLLWQSIKSLEDKAGTIPSLFEQVMQNSNFLSPQLLTNLVTKL
jgi:hypothetical protein